MKRAYITLTSGKIEEVEGFTDGAVQDGILTVYWARSKEMLMWPLHAVERIHFVEEDDSEE